MAKIDYESAMKALRIQRYRNIAGYDDVVDLGIKARWDELSSQIKDSDLDPTDVFGEELEMLRDAEYSMKLMNICCLCETWEQDLYSFLKGKGLITATAGKFGDIDARLKQGYPSCATSNYPEIQEMRDLVNAIKHGEGRSFTNLRRSTSDSILADSNIGVMDASGKIIKKKEIEYDPNTLTSRTLKVDGKLQKYSEAIIKFWEDVYQSEMEEEDSSELE